MANLRKEKQASRISTVVSLVMHAVIAIVVIFFAARGGMLGDQLKKIAVIMVPKEKPPEKPKEKPPEPKPREETVKTETKAAPVATTPAPTRPSVAAPPPSGTVPAVAAPPAADLPAFDFDGGKPVDSSGSPAGVYKGFVEYTLRSHWNRPEGIDDDAFTAEVNLALDTNGKIVAYTWEKKSGNAKWDDSVKKAVEGTTSLGRPPPAGFPRRVLVRFDVQPATDAAVP